jgi:hypothetical protein
MNPDQNKNQGAADKGEHPGNRPGEDEVNPKPTPGRKDPNDPQRRGDEQGRGEPSSKPGHDPYETSRPDQNSKTKTDPQR